MIDSKDTVLVTGGTGFTGSHLLRELSKTGASIRVIARASSSRNALSDLPIEWHIGDVFDEATVLQAMDGVNVLFHVAAAYREASITDEVYWKVHVRSTQLLAQAATQLPNFKRMVHVSTVGVHGHIENPPANENYRFAPGDIYQNTKVEGEQWISTYAQEHGLPLTVVRPAAIYGPGDRRLLKVFKFAKLPICPLIGMKSKGLYHLIHVEDLVRFLLLVADHKDSLNEVFICGNDKATSIREIVAIIAHYLGREARFLRVPAFPFFIIGDVCEWLCKPFGVEPPIYRRRVAFFTKDRSFDTRKMQERLNFHCLHSNEDGLELLAEWYRNQGWL